MDTLFIGLLLFVLMLGVRNTWVHKVRSDYIHAALDALRKIPAHLYTEEKQKQFKLEWPEIPYSYEKMLFMFWIWDFDWFMRKVR